LPGCRKSDLSTPKGAALAFAQALEAGDAGAARKASTGGDPQLLDAMGSRPATIKPAPMRGVPSWGR